MAEARPKSYEYSRDIPASHESSPRLVPQRLRPALTYVYFDAVACHGSIRKAAEALHIASSALNRRILELEDEVGSLLFERLPRGVRLTTAGELFLSYVRRSIKDLRTLELQIEGLRRQRHGTVRIAVAESVTPRLLPDAISSYRNAHPGVDFHVTVDGPERLSDALLKDEADLILTHEPVEKPSITVLAEARHPLCALVAADHPLAHRVSVHLSECTSYPLALPDTTLAARALLDLAIEMDSVPINPVLVSNSIETLKTFARSSNAICFSFHLGDEAEGSGLIALQLRHSHCAEARLYLAARRGRVLPVAAASFAEILREALQKRALPLTISEE